MGRPSNAEVAAEKAAQREQETRDIDRYAAMEVLREIIRAKGGYVSDYANWAIDAVDVIRKHYGQ